MGLGEKVDATFLCLGNEDNKREGENAHFIKCSTLLFEDNNYREGENAHFIQ